ncbi:MAG: hypothetical protein ACRDND_27030 [Streptosporangiaceae bacterium]
MDTPTRTDPPYVPIRTNRWAPHQKTPRWMLLAGALIVVGIVLVALVHKPTQTQRAGDLKGYLTDVNTDIESCAGGVSESLSALHQINAGANSASNVQDTIKIARYGASNCSPANNEQLDDLTQYQVNESLAGYHLDTAVNDVITWAFPYAQRVQNDVANELGTRDAAKRQEYTATLQRDTGDLNRQRAKIDKIMMKAITATGARAAPPHLPG